MSIVSRLSIRGKLVTGFVAVSLLTGMMGGVGVWSTSKVNSLLDEMYDNNLVSIATVEEAKIQITRFSRLMYIHLLETDEAKLKDVVAQIQQARQKYEEAIKEYAQTDLSEDERPISEKVNTAFAKYVEVVPRILEISSQNKKAEALAFARTGAMGYFRDLEAGLDELVRINRDQAKAAYHDSDVVYAKARMILIGGSVIATLAAVVLGVLLTLGITRPIGRVITTLRRGAEQTASASSQVSQSSQQMAEGASEQASSLEEVSSSLEEMASMTKQNADNAGQANSVAAEARSAAEQGNTAMARMAEAIHQIKSSSDQTAKIVKTIDEIAFQTNLLALNAAVEAARAGDAGKGFAVVAQEVRSLAQRSAEAAKNTAGLIEESQKNADNGVAVSSEVAGILTQIIAGVQKVNQLIGEVSAASKEQSQGIEQITTAVSQMDKVTQNNAANAEESASASEELSAQAKDLSEMVNALVTIVEGARVGTGRDGSEKAEAGVLTDVIQTSKAKPGRVDDLLHKTWDSQAERKTARQVRSGGHKAESVIPLDAEELKTS